MAGSSFGSIFKITTWGESHGFGVGVVVDGVPAGLSISEADIQEYLNRRKPGQSKYTTQRNESDEVQILSGVFEGKTTGTSISMMVKNKDHHSADYSNIANTFRPGHADYTFDQKYGFRDYRGGGRSSGRETIGRVAGGAIAAIVLKEMGISITTWVDSVGPIHSDPSAFDAEFIANNDLFMADRGAYEKARTYLDQLRADGNSSGAIASCRISGLPAGLGDPVFEKLDANLAKAMFSIGAVKGFEIGSGFGAATATGADNNDAFTLDGDDVRVCTNHAGGILGGMSSGADLFFRTAFKPTPSISTPQDTITVDGQTTKLTIKGRHDPIIAPRALVVIECMSAIVLLDAMMVNMSSKLDGIKAFYER